MKSKLKKNILHAYQWVRVRILTSVSSTLKMYGFPTIDQPAQFLGNGKMTFGKNVRVGYYPSPFYFSGYAYFEARGINSEIIVGSNVIFNNNFVCVAEDKISIGNKVLIGTNVEICDSDFHTIYPKQRNDKNHLRNPVELGENCWIGSNVKILKGVKLGENVVVSNGSVVTKSFGPNLVIGGVPATILKTISEN